MPRSRIAQSPSWRKVLIVSVVVPLALFLAMAAFAWPMSRTAPRNLPVGVVETGVGAEPAVQALTGGSQAFDVQLYGDEAAARTAIRHRDIYGAFVLGPTGITVLTASAASPSVAQLLATYGQHLAGADGPGAGQQPGSTPLVVDDVVSASSKDPHQTVLSSAILPLVLGGVILAVAVGLLVGFTSGWRKGVALVTASAVAGLGAYLIAQPLLGALPGQHVATWAALSLIVLAISAATAGLFALLGLPGIGLGAALMIVVGNPFSGASTAPDLLPEPAGHIGQWLPPGAGGSLLRSTAYFDGHGATGPALVLATWAVVGLAVVLVGRRRRTRPRVEVTVESLVAA